MIISHTIKPSYFSTAKKGYHQFNAEAGDTVDFYNILYLQEPNHQYDSYS
jgi:hypothetical protein